MTIGKHQQNSTSIGLSIILLSCGLSHLAVGQTTPTQQPTPAPQKQGQAVSLKHLYWHFLVYQSHLDTKATENSSKGKDGSLMRDVMKKKLGFTDSDFKLIRTSSARLTSEISDLDSQAATIRATGRSPQNHAKLHGLTVQREKDIDAEVASLKQALTPGQIKRLEAFLADLFSPANAVARPSPSATQTASPAVHP